LSTSNGYVYNFAGGFLSGSASLWSDTSIVVESGGTLVVDHQVHITGSLTLDSGSTTVVHFGIFCLTLY
jgi:hypothetical protein